MDATLAVSQGGANKLLTALISLASASASDSVTLGPFSVGYTASVALSGGTVTLLDAPLNRVRVRDVVASGSVGATFTFDLGAILPRICIPPVRVCVRIPFIGRVCTPQVCIDWPAISVPVTVPFAVGIEQIDFGLSVASAGPDWQINLLVFPFSLQIDLSPMAGAILGAISSAVTAALSAIPLIGGLLAGLVSTVLSALTAVLASILSVISGLVNALISGLALFSPAVPIQLLTISKAQPFLPAGFPRPGEPQVDITVAALDATILDQELVATATIA